MNKIIVAIVLLLLIAGAYWYFNPRTQLPLTPAAQDASTATSTQPQEHVSLQGFSLTIPAGAEALDDPGNDTYAPALLVRGSFGQLCVSTGKGCADSQPQGEASTTKTLATRDGDLELKEFIKGNNVVFVGDLKFSPRTWTPAGQIQAFASTSEATTIETILSSLDFN